MLCERSRWQCQLDRDTRSLRVKNKNSRQPWLGLESQEFCFRFLIRLSCGDLIKSCSEFLKSDPPADHDPRTWSTNRRNFTNCSRWIEEIELDASTHTKCSWLKAIKTSFQHASNRPGTRRRFADKTAEEFCDADHEDFYSVNFKSNTCVWALPELVRELSRSRIRLNSKITTYGR